MRLVDCRHLCKTFRCDRSDCMQRGPLIPADRWVGVHLRSRLLPSGVRRRLVVRALRSRLRAWDRRQPLRGLHVRQVQRRRRALRSMRARVRAGPGDLGSQLHCSNRTRNPTRCANHDCLVAFQLLTMILRVFSATRTRRVRLESRAHAALQIRWPTRRAPAAHVRSTCTTAA